MSDIITAITIKNMAREMVKKATAKNAGEIVEMNGKKYRCVREPRRESDFGSWEFLHNGLWHEVLNYQIRADLNRKAGYWGAAKNADDPKFDGSGYLLDKNGKPFFVYNDSTAGLIIRKYKEMGVNLKAEKDRIGDVYFKKV